MGLGQGAVEGLDLSVPFGDVYRGKRVLVTGHTGFKGSWLAHWLHELGATVAGIALDPDTTPSHWQLLENDGITDLRIDLANAKEISSAIEHFAPEFVFHLAAQPLVRRSYQQPTQTFATNVMGLVNVLEALRLCPSVRVLVNATTDKVYEATATAGYRETDPLGGHDPYSTSKACAELITQCYRRSFFTDGSESTRVSVATARAGNVIGGGDWAQDRLVPDLVRAVQSGQQLVLRNPDAIRPWQHVLEPLSGYLLLGQKLSDDAGFSGAWNFGPGAAGEVSVAGLVSGLGRHWPALLTKVDDRGHPHEANVLRLDCSKAAELLAWRPVWTAETTLARTAGWYRAFHEQGYVSTPNDLAAYVSDARSQGQAWAS